MLKPLAKVDIGTWFKFGKPPAYCDPYDPACGPSGIRAIWPTFGSFISTLLPNVYIIAGVILLILLIFGGFTYIVNAGKQKPEGVQKGQNAIGAALIGFLLIFISWWIIQLIEIITGIEILK